MTIKDTNNSSAQLKAVDFFSGAGGMSCGFSQAGVNILAGIDIEGQFEATYLANHPSAQFIKQDITKYQPQDLQEKIGIEKYDDKLIFIGCSPCQYWSNINNIKHKSAYSNNLVYDFQRFIKYFMPGYVVVENVPGIVKQKDNHVLLQFMDFLLFHGYKAEWKIIRTDDYGVPQHRKRFVLIATRLPLKIQFPTPEKRKDLTVYNFIGQHNGFPVLADGHKDPNNFMDSTAALGPLNRERLRVTPANGGNRLAWANNANLQIPAYKDKPDHFKSIYGRLFWHKPSSTITTRFIAISCGRFSHPEEHRGLSLREGATLQTFPRTYKFIGSVQSVAKQIGNAVPPEMARRIALSIQTSQ
ncbi:MAG: DNA cytosine methyltransferase [Sphingobacteriales bacterium]|nr:MAG: DNA cytosine methyltransferase [Sphingobacteriales bacterium]